MISAELAILSLHALATVMMAGLIWFVQVVHYPMFALLDGEHFTRYARIHAERTTWVVAPLMLIEAATAAYLALNPPAGINPVWTVAGLSLLILIWISTAALQVPCHGRLSEQFDHGVVRRLVGTNWIRTVAWTARAGLALAFIAAQIGQL